MQIFSPALCLGLSPWSNHSVGWGPFHPGWPAPSSSPAFYSFWKSACFTLHLLNLEFSSLTLPFFIFLQDFMKIFSNLLFTWYFQYFSFVLHSFSIASVYCMFIFPWISLPVFFIFHCSFSFHLPFILMSIFPVESFHPCSRMRRHLTAGCRHKWRLLPGSGTAHGAHWDISASHPGLACPPAFWAPDQVSLQPPPVTHGVWGLGSHPPLNLQTPWVWGKCTAGEWLLLQTLKPHTGASLVAQMVKDLSTVLVTWVRSPGQEDPLEKGMATHCSIPAWDIPWTEEPGGL